MNILKKFVALSSLVAATSAFAVPVVKEYSINGWSLGDGVANTVAAVGGLTFAGQVSNAGSLVGTDIVVAGQWSSMFTSWVAGGGY